MIKKSQEIQQLTIEPLKQGRVTLRIIGRTPMYQNNMSLKARRTLAIGGAKKTAAEKKELKHNPEEEFRQSIHRMPDGSPTLIGFPAAGVKGAMATAAIHTAGIAKTAVNRLIFLPQEKIAIYGKPYLKLDVVRSADINRTPDIRSRAFLPEWCAEVDVAFIENEISAYSIMSLLMNAGTIIGIGDFRQEKGKGSFGAFHVFGDDMGDFQSTWDEITTQARDVQERAMAYPEAADDESAELLEFIDGERLKRSA